MQREQFDITGMHWSTRVERCAAELPGIASVWRTKQHLSGWIDLQQTTPSKPLWKKLGVSC
ncbi:hypothetical protein I310019A7_10880 [Lawsonibacter asaccharolyticus]|jgi:hypothetical protein